MKKTVCIILAGAVCTTAFSQNPRWKEAGTPIPARPELDVRWEAPVKTLPPSVWVYHLLPNHFSSEAISNVLNLCSFTEKDKTAQSADGLTFQSPDATRKLSISFRSGSIHYETASRHYDFSHLAEGVPDMAQIPVLTSNFAAKVGIPIADVTGYFGTNRFEYTERGSVFYNDHTSVTNIEYRVGYFRRSVDGWPIVGGDGGSVHFGERGNICEISFSWRNMERRESCPTVSEKAMMTFLRQGKGRLGLVSDDVGDINWSGVKSVTIQKVWPSYYAGSSDWLYPYMAFWTTVDTGRGNVEVEVDCPVIDEAKLLSGVPQPKSN